MTKVIINTDIYDYHSYKTGMYVVFDKVVKEVGKMSDYVAQDVAEVIDGRGMLLMPGHIIGHSHIYSAFSKGIKLDSFAPRTFTERLRQFWWKLDKEYDLDACYQSARVCGIEYLKSGITTVFDHHAGGYITGSLDAIKRGIVDELGMRAMLAFETSDRFDIDRCIRENVDFANRNVGGMCRGMFGMHASLSLSEKTLDAVSEARNGIPIHVHCGESLEEELESLNSYGMRSAQRYAAHGLLDKNALLAHCTNIDEREADVIKEYGAVVAVNPTANLNANNGIPDLGMMKQKGLHVIVGTDAIDANITREYNNLFFVTQYKLNDRTTKLYTKGDLLESIRYVYRYAGELLGVNLGRIDAGYEADMLLVPYNISTVINEENIFSYVTGNVYGRFVPKMVFVKGECKVKDYASVFDEETIYKESRESCRKVWERVAKNDGKSMH